MKKPNYLKEWVSSQFVVVPFSISLVLSIMLIGLTRQWNIGMIPLVTWACLFGLSLIGNIHVSEWFRNKVDALYRNEHWEQSKVRLLQMIDSTRPSGRIPTTRMQSINRYVDEFKEMDEKISKMYRFAQERQGQITLGELDQLREAALNYLSMLYLWASEDESLENNKKMTESERTVRGLKISLQDPSVSEAKKVQMRKMVAEYEEMIERIGRRIHRLEHIEMLLKVTPDKMDELYQILMLAPYSEGTGTQIGERLKSLLKNEALKESAYAEIDELDNDYLDEPLTPEPSSQAKKKQTTLTA